MSPPPLESGSGQSTSNHIQDIGRYKCSDQAHNNEESQEQEEDEQQDHGEGRMARTEIRCLP